MALQHTYERLEDRALPSRVDDDHVGIGVSSYLLDGVINATMNH